MFRSTILSVRKALPRHPWLTPQYTQTLIRQSLLKTACGQVALDLTVWCAAQPKLPLVCKYKKRKVLRPECWAIQMLDQEGPVGPSLYCCGGLAVLTSEPWSSLMTRTANWETPPMSLVLRLV